MHGMQPLNMEVEREDLRKTWTHKKIKPKPLVCCRHSIMNQCTCTLQCQGWRHSHHALCPYQELQREFRKEIFFPFRKEAFSRRTYVKKYCSCYSHCAPVSAEGWETLHSTQKLPPSYNTIQRNLSFCWVMTHFGQAVKPRNHPERHARNFCS